MDLRRHVPHVVQPWPWKRASDRRRGFSVLLSDLVGRPPNLETADTLITRFEEGTRKLLSAEHVRVVDPELNSAADGTGQRDALLLEIPTAGRKTYPRLEVVFAAGRALNDWDRQVLTFARDLAVLLVQLQQARQSDAAPVLNSTPFAEGPSRLLGSSAAIHAVRQRISRLARTDVTVLIEGESGTGKELVARGLHDASPQRRDGPFVAVNCAALVDTLLEAELFGIEDRTATGVRGRRGKFELANGGTLFLDEVGDLSLGAQAKLLRVLQDLSVERVGGHGTRRLNIRVVAATNRSLDTMVRAKLFRPDLYYRLSGVEILVPPLRARPQDIVELAQHFLMRYRSPRGFRLSPMAVDALLAYDWPGNVRELERAIERAVALTDSDDINLADLPPIVTRDYADVVFPSLEREETLRSWASRYVRLVLQREHNNKRRACQVLGVSYHTLQAYLRHAPKSGHCPSAQAMPGCSEQAARKPA